MAKGSPRQILVFAPYARWTPHLETDLEITENHLAAGDVVRWMVCDGEMEICDVNMDHRRRECLACVARRHKGLSLLPADVPLVRYEDFLTDEDRRRVAGLSLDIGSAEELRGRMFEGFDVGLAALSSVMSYHRDDGIEPRDHVEALRRYLRTSAGVFLAVRNYLRAHPTDLVYLFNGRMAPPRGVLRACQQAGVACCVHERGATLSQYLLTHGDMPHMIDKQLARIRAGWDDPQVSQEDKVRIAKQWYEERARGRMGDGIAFTDRQKLGELPADFRDNRRNLAIFTSSEWEINAVTDEWRNPLYLTAGEGIRDIIAGVAASGESIHVYVRIHPSRESADSKQVREFLAIDAPNVTVLGPHDPVCSYALMRACEKSIVTGSTMGIESTFWGKPAVLAGQAVWRKLGGAHVAEDRDHLMRLVLDRALPALDRDGAIMYGYDRATMGQAFRHFESVSFFDGLYRGVRIDEPDQFLGGWPHGEGLRLAGASDDEVNLGLLGAKARALPGPADGPQRLEIERLFPDGPAHVGGLMVGDVVVGMGREPQAARSAYLGALARALCEAEAGGDKVRLVVERPGEPVPLVLRLRVPIVDERLRNPTKPAARAHVLQQAIRWLVACDVASPPDLATRVDSPMSRLLGEGLSAHAAGKRATQAFWKAHGTTLTLARAPDGSLQPPQDRKGGTGVDVARGSVWITAAWASLLAGGPEALQLHLRQFSGATK